MTGYFSADDAAGAVFTEFDEFQNFRDLREIDADLFQRVAQRKFTAEENTVQMLDDRDRFVVKTRPLKTDFVDHFDSAVAAFCHHERRHVFGVSRKSGDDSEASDPAELVNRHQTGEDNIVEDFGITSGDSSVDVDNIISDFAVMSDMAGRHKQTVVADDGFGSGFGSAVDGGGFAENVVVADFDIGGGTGYNGVILCGLSDSGEGVKDIVFTEGGVTIDTALTDKTGTGTDFDVGTNVAKRTDFNTVSEDGTVHYDTCRMNFRHNIFPFIILIKNQQKLLSSVYYTIKIRYKQVLLLVKCELLRYFIVMTKNNSTEFRVTLVLDRLRSAHNTGNIFRIAEALGAEIAACGYTPCPPHPKLEKTAMGADKMVKCRHFETSLEAVQTLRREGYRMIVAAEPGGEEAWEAEYSFPLALILGNEALGVSEDTLKNADKIVSLPMLGEKASINVGNAAAAILYAVAAKHGTKR